MDILTFTVAELPPGLNQIKRMHWAAYMRLRDRWLLLVRMAIGKNMRCFPGRVAITYTAYRVQLMDKDNNAGSFKLVGDALVKLGVIRDDGPKIVDEEQSHYSQEQVTHRNEQRIEVTIKDHEGPNESIRLCCECGGIIDPHRPYLVSRHGRTMHTECYTRVNTMLKQRGLGPMVMRLVNK